MVKKKKSVKRKVAKKVDKCGVPEHCGGILFSKLGAMAFILFLITVWDGAMNLVHTIHWGWFLGAAIIFCGFGMKKHCKY